MEIRDYARSILLEPSLDAKLTPPPQRLTDEAPGVPGMLAALLGPNRDPSIAIETDARRKRKVPAPAGFVDLSQRPRILNGLANHELQAIELFAWALLVFPSAPPAFRRGLVAILAEEQEHFRLYASRLSANGGRFGQWPLSGYFWTRAASLTTPLQFVSAMCLTFENANLDHALALERVAIAAGDVETAAVLRQVHDDEIGHVRFGLHWLREWSRKGQSPAQAWRESLVFPLRPELARGDLLDEESRRTAGFDEEFISLLAVSTRPRALYRVENPE